MCPLPQPTGCEYIHSLPRAPPPYINSWRHDLRMYDGIILHQLRFSLQTLLLWKILYAPTYSLHYTGVNLSMINASNWRGESW